MSRSIRWARTCGNHAMLTITRGYSWNGFACRPYRRRTSRIISLLMIVKSRPNLSRISSCHFSARLGGHTTIAVRARCRSSSSCTTKPASMVLPKPTSSASSRFVRGEDSARRSGSSWYASTATPLWNGACTLRSSAEVTAPQRIASTNPARVFGSSKASGLTCVGRP